MSICETLANLILISQKLNNEFVDTIILPNFMWVPFLEECRQNDYRHRERYEVQTLKEIQFNGVSVAKANTKIMIVTYRDKKHV